jgi:competence protein CoiA
MKFALINGIKSEATKGINGTCPICDSELIAKCGELKIHHWAHKGNRNCDPWWENETDWHRNWKNKFPSEWQEVVHYDKTGEKHIADIKTQNEWVIEFQHSFLNSEERRARNTFYGKIIWVVDGTRRKRDKVQLTKALNHGELISNRAPVRRVRVDECTLLQEWFDSPPVFFDFGGEQILWWLLNGGSNGLAYISPFSCSDFIKIHGSGPNQKFDDFTNFVKDVSGLVRNYESSIRKRG